MRPVAQRRHRAACWRRSRKPQTMRRCSDWRRRSLDLYDNFVARVAAETSQSNPLCAHGHAAHRPVTRRPRPPRAPASEPLSRARRHPYALAARDHGARTGGHHRRSWRGADSSPGSGVGSASDRGTERGSDSVHRAVRTGASIAGERRCTLGSRRDGGWPVSGFSSRARRGCVVGTDYGCRRDICRSSAAGAGTAPASVLATTSDHPRRLERAVLHRSVARWHDARRGDG